MLKLFMIGIKIKKIKKSNRVLFPFGRAQWVIPIDTTRDKTRQDPPGCLLYCKSRSPPKGK